MQRHSSLQTARGKSNIPSMWEVLKHQEMKWAKIHFFPAKYFIWITSMNFDNPEAYTYYFLNGMAHV